MKREDNGFFIALEGVNGTGKSTLIERLSARLRAAGHEDIVTTREPWGEDIRGWLKATPSGGPALRLATRDRHVHTREVIRPALERGALVISDRYYASTAAYQGESAGMIRSIYREQAGIFPAPDFWILVVCEADLSRERIVARDNGEAPSLGRLMRYQRGYGQLILESIWSPFVIANGERGVSGESLDMLAAIVQDRWRQRSQQSEQRGS